MEEAVLKAIREDIRKAEAELEILARDIEMAKMAGIDVEALEKAYAELKRKVDLLKAVYGT